MDIEEDEDDILYFEEKEIRDFASKIKNICADLKKQFLFLSHVIAIKLNPDKDIEVKEVCEYVYIRGQKGENSWVDNFDEQYQFKSDNVIYKEFIRQFQENIQILKNMDDMYKPQDETDLDQPSSQNIKNKDCNGQEVNQNLIGQNEEFGNSFSNLDKIICENCLAKMNMVCLTCREIICQLCHESKEHKIKHCVLQMEMYEQFKELIKVQQKTELYSLFYFMNQDLLKCFALWEFNTLENFEEARDKVKEIFENLNLIVNKYISRNQDMIKSVVEIPILDYFKQQFERQTITKDTYYKLLKLCDEFQHENQSDSFGGIQNKENKGVNIQDLMMLNIVFQDPLAQ